jgi:hypothetical protein
LRDDFCGESAVEVKMRLAVRIFSLAAAREKFT